MRCGREVGGDHVDHLGVCPAYPDHGRKCANVVGTFCDLVQVLKKSSHTDCYECSYYNSIHFDEHARRENEKNKKSGAFSK